MEIFEGVILKMEDNFNYFLFYEFAIFYYLYLVNELHKLSIAMTYRNLQCRYE